MSLVVPKSIFFRLYVIKQENDTSLQATEAETSSDAIKRLSGLRSLIEFSNTNTSIGACAIWKTDEGSPFLKT